LPLFQTVQSHKYLMSKSIKLKKGFNINLAGKAEKKLADSHQRVTFAIKPTDFVGMQRPKVLVNIGDNVKSGQPVLIDKKLEAVLYTAPVSGEVVEINRGAKRSLLEIVILADKEIQYESFKSYSSSEIQEVSREDAQSQMLVSGVWPQIIQRPYGVVANPEETPKSIFISAFDSSPLAPDYNYIFKGKEKEFQAGVDVLKKFTSGKIHVTTDGDGDVNSMFTQMSGVNNNRIQGPHPVGNVGIQIHHIDPICKGDLVWTVNPFGVIQIGKLFLEGKYDASKVIAIAGSEINTPQYIKTYLGANIKEFVKDNLKSDNVRCISGNPLTGERISDAGYLGFYHHQLTVIPEGDYQELFGWVLPSSKKLSFHRALGLLSFLNNKNKEYVIDTNTKGEPRAFVQTGAFEKVVPMDILPTYLIKSILAEDFEEMEALGIYEIIEEDFALCEFIDVSKHDIQSIVRDGLNLMQYS